MSTFPFVSIGSEKGAQGKVELYRFRNLFNDFVIVEVFHYRYNVYAVKFYLKKHSLSKNKYNLVYPQKFKENKYNLVYPHNLNYPQNNKVEKKLITGNKNFRMVLNTILLISLDIKKNDKIASFGFLGAPRLTELDPLLNSKNINSDGTVSKTVRFNVYYEYAKNRFNPIDFEYIVSETSSIMLLRNNLNSKILTKSVVEKYIISELIPTL